MKVSVITRHAITNYGSLLQALATQTAVERLGFKCEIIDYIRDDESYVNHEKTILKRKSNWNKNIVKRIIYLALRQPENIIAGIKFEKERRAFLNLTRRYRSLDELNKDIPQADVYMTGSDQVWGPTEDGTYDSAYCLSFAGNAKKISYAASFGHTDMNNELEQYFKNNLFSYKHISVRENSAAKIVNGLGFEAKQVLDPTLLFDKRFWEGITEKPKNGDYILVYQLHNNSKLNEYAEKVAKEKGMKLIRISVSLHQIFRGGSFIWCPSIAQFLGYIENAKMLITDSFHGTAFAINFNTQFVEVLPNNNTGTRNVSILQLTGLSDRIVSDDNPHPENEIIDFSYANKILKEKRKESQNLLKEMIIG